jgi:excinuclease ABC subunit B
MSEDLTRYYEELGVRVRYMHSEVDALERAEIIRDLRLGEFDVLVGINLLREGLDLPEVALIGIFDADKEGYLRSYRALIQTCGRAARNLNGRVLFYADKITESMRLAIDETERRRAIQAEHNRKYGITPRAIVRAIEGRLAPEAQEDMAAERPRALRIEDDLPRQIAKLEQQMLSAAKNLDFEKAAELRDAISYLKKKEMGLAS